MSICRIISCIVERRCLLWPIHSLGRTLLAFALLHFVLPGQICSALGLPLLCFLSHLWGIQGEINTLVFIGRIAKMKLLVAQLFPTVTTWTLAHQLPLSMAFSRQESWSWLPFPSPGDLPDPGIKLMFPTLQTNSHNLSHQRNLIIP